MEMYLGLANGDVPRHPSGFDEDLLARWSAEGIRCLAVNFLPDPTSVRDEVGALRKRLDAHGIHVAQMAGVNANLVHPDPEVRAIAEASVVAALPVAAALGATMISSGCGTARDDWREHFYGPHPANFRREAQERLVEGLRAIAPHVEDAGLRYTIECHQLSVMRSPEIIREVLDAVDSPVITANFDPVNLLVGAEQVFDNAARMRHMVETVGPRYGPSCHIKDVRVTDDLVCRVVEAPPGEGVLDHDAFFEAAARLPGPTALVVEHLDPERSTEGVRYVREQAQRCGVVLL